MLGDLNAQVEKLKAQLRLLRFPIKDFMENGVMTGKPIALLPILHYIFFSFSKPFATFVRERGYELYAKSDLRFVEECYKVLRKEMHYRPTLSTQQFFSNGFVERKVMLLQDIIRVVRRWHNETVGQRDVLGGSTASALSGRSGSTLRSGGRTESAKVNKVVAGNSSVVSHLGAEPSLAEMMLRKRSGSEGAAGGSAGRPVVASQEHHIVDTSNMNVTVTAHDDMHFSTIRAARKTSSLADYDVAPAKVFRDFVLDAAGSVEQESPALSDALFSGDAQRLNTAEQFCQEEHAVNDSLTPAAGAKRTTPSRGGTAVGFSMELDHTMPPPQPMSLDVQRNPWDLQTRTSGAAADLLSPAAVTSSRNVAKNRSREEAPFVVSGARSDGGLARNNLSSPQESAAGAVSFSSFNHFVSSVEQRMSEMQQTMESLAARLTILEMERKLDQARGSTSGPATSSSSTTGLQHQSQSAAAAAAVPNKSDQPSCSMTATAGGGSATSSTPSRGPFTVQWTSSTPSASSSSFIRAGVNAAPTSTTTGEPASDQLSSKSAMFEFDHQRILGLGATKADTKSTMAPSPDDPFGADADNFLSQARYDPTPTASVFTPSSVVYARTKSTPATFSGSCGASRCTTNNHGHAIGTNKFATGNIGSAGGGVTDSIEVSIPSAEETQKLIVNLTEKFRDTQALLEKAKAQTRRRTASHTATSTSDAMASGVA
ncbi:unnamed protein product [Amoebophrya sp. A25]|nr:unnamed protein product [Amoebophrya sp. A25]|eukprot:GSA25T00006046001.1